MKGGYQARSRLERVRDEIAMEMMEVVRAESPERKRRAFREAVRLTRDYIGLLTHINSGLSPTGFAGA